MKLQNICWPFTVRIPSTVWALVPLGLLATLAITAVPTQAAPGQLTTKADDLTELSLEALMNLEVTSVSRKPQRLSNTAAAVFVISQEDIRRSGATTIPDLLRMVPGVQVAKIDANKWAVSIRGINGRFVGKLQVLKDGRSLYTPLYSGVFWETLDTPLEDIERIEVIRGPGAAMWGANAVNGVINIITKHAADTQGGLVSGGTGSSEKGFGTVRFGKQLSDDSYLRLYGKHAEHGEGKDVRTGNDAYDGWQMTTAGFRLDTQPTFDDALTVQGDYYNGRYNEIYNLYTPLGIPYQQPATSTASGANLLARWERTFSDSANLSLQLSYDHSERELYVLGEKRDTLDLDFQNRFRLSSRQELLWGLGYRYSHDQIKNTPIAGLSKSSEGLSLYGIFLQDEITLVPDTLSLILGSRFEHNDYTGWEIQPNGRLIWTPSPQHTFWGSISRAVRTPSRTERYLQYTAATLPGPINVEVDGSSAFKSETVLAYELGYRTELPKQISLGLSIFFNQYEKLRVSQASVLDITTLPPTLRMPLSNDAHGHAYGAELSASWRPYDWWRLQAAYHYLRTIIYLDNGSPDDDNRSNSAEGAPRHQFSLRSGFDLPKQVELDLWLRAVERVDYINREQVPGYVTMDARLAWKPVKNLELALVGQNLFQRRHPEYKPEFIDTVRSEVPRSVYGKVTLQF